jgi:hypothetical protein
MQVKGRLRGFSTLTIKSKENLNQIPDKISTLIIIIKKGDNPRVNFTV